MNEKEEAGWGKIKQGKTQVRKNHALVSERKKAEGITSMKEREGDRNKEEKEGKEKGKGEISLGVQNKGNMVREMKGRERAQGK